jgi:hypothetical protein
MKQLVIIFSGKLPYEPDSMEMNTLSIGKETSKLIVIP